MATHTRFARNFTPDLRRLKSWPSMKGSLWRQPYLIELTYAKNFQLVKESIPGKKLKILEVGCGTGFMSLELARMGHYVTAIDRNKDLVSLAKRTASTDPYRKTRGGLTFDIANFDRWTGRPEAYDIVLFSRVLHDMPQPERILSKARVQLKEFGRIICLEYAYNLLDRRAATWLFQIRRILEVAGWTQLPHLPEKPHVGVNKIMRENSERKQHINSYNEMRKPLVKLFDEELLSWHPYHYWDILANMRIPDKRQQKSFAALLRSIEEFLIRSGEIQPVLFRFVGTKTRR